MISQPIPWSIDNPGGMALAVKWTEALVQKITQGGTWIVPRSGSIYVLDHARKVVTRKTGGDSSVERVFVEMGWKVKTERAASHSG